MEQLNQTILHGLDLPLGWLLLLPRDVSVFVFSLLTALLMTAVRRWFTDQHLLHRCANDLRQLRQLDRRAKQIADKPQRQRLRRTVAMIKQMQLPEDMKLLAVVIVPVAVLAIWGAERLDYRPPRWRGTDRSSLFPNLVCGRSDASHPSQRRRIRLVTDPDHPIRSTVTQSRNGRMVCAYDVSD